MTAWHLSGVVLPGTQPTELWIGDGLVSAEPIRGAQTIARDAWIMPGLVDAHCHIGLGPRGAVDRATAEQQAITDRDAGVLLIRDAGAPVDTHWVDNRPDLPRIIRAGRHVAVPTRYIRNFAVEIDPGDLVAQVEHEARAGDGWVKLVGDWIDRDAGDLAPLWTRGQLEAAVAAAHESGARITAHVFGYDALPDIIASGFDSIEHGTGLTPDLVDEMITREIALVPTLIQVENFPGIAAGADRFPVYQANMRTLYANSGDVYTAAREAGVAMYAGTDAGGFVEHGRIVDEVEALTGIGMTPLEALAAASTSAREWLGVAGIVDGARADFLVLDADPAQDLTTLRRPAHIVCSGRLLR